METDAGPWNSQMLAFEQARWFLFDLAWRTRLRFLLITPQDSFSCHCPSQILCKWCMQLYRVTVDVIFFTKTNYHVSTGWPIEHEWPADSHQRRISPGTVQSRRHGDTEALDVVRGQLPGHYPARRAPRTPTGRPGRSLNAVSVYCWLVKTIQAEFPGTIESLPNGSKNLQSSVFIL